MKAFIPFVLIMSANALMIQTARADELLFEAPLGMLIRMDSEECPEGRQCVSTTHLGFPQGPDDVMLILPEWARTDIPPGAQSQSTLTYMRGLSDSIISDVCNACACCEIRIDEAGSDFMPWEPLTAEQMQLYRDMRSAE